MNRITCKLMGGLGNQLFQVATTLVTAVTQNNKMLPVFVDTPPEDWEERKKLESYTGQRPNYWSTVFHQLMLVTNADNYLEYHESADHKYKQIPQFPVNTKINGYWQCPKYFEHHRKELIQALSLPKDNAEYVAKQYLELSQGKKTLGIHVRRTDYLLNKWELPIEYYSQALNMIIDQSLKVLIFTDDQKWCAQYLSPLLNGRQVKYVNEADYHELFLMTLCDNLIIANSSFSWWGAFLSQKANKIVCPSPWLIDKNTGLELCPDIYPSGNTSSPKWDKLDYRNSQDLIHIANNPTKTGRLCNKLFQLSHLIALKHEIVAKTQRSVVIHYDVGDYKYLNNISGLLQPVNDIKLQKWNQPTFAFSEVPEDYYSKGFMVDGYVQSHKFFEKYRDLIIEQWKSLQIGCDPRTADTIFTQLIGNVAASNPNEETPVIAIHVRRTDYTNLPHHPVIPLKYYRDAISLMETRLNKSRKQCKYLIFSDDPEWAVKQKWGIPFTVVNSRHVKESNGVPDVVLDYIDLLIMSKCHGFIIANSSYSWWGAYLSKSKYVIYPDPWFADILSKENTEDLCPDWWVGIRWESYSPNKILKEMSSFLHKIKDRQYQQDRNVKELDRLIVEASRLGRYSDALELFDELLKVDVNREYLIKHRPRLMYNLEYLSPSLLDKLKPVVSVIIPSYRRPVAVKRAIESVLNQSLQDLEVIVVNDASPESEYLLLEQFFNDSRLKVLNLPINTGKKYGTTLPQGLTRMEGVNASSGKWLAFLDDDDFYCDKDKLSKQLTMLSKANGVDSVDNANLVIPKLKYRMCSTNMIMGSNGYDNKYSIYEQPHKNLYLNQTFGTSLSEQKVFKVTENTIKDTNYINCSTVLVERKVFIDAGGMKAEKPEDYPCWKRVLLLTDAIYINEPTVWYDMTSAGGKQYS